MDKLGVYFFRKKQKLSTHKDTAEPLFAGLCRISSKNVEYSKKPSIITVFSSNISTDFF